jgi:hypothetical protein
MSHAYTPGLQRKTDCVIRKMRLLPLPGEILVRIGETVNCNTTVGKVNLPGDCQTINVATELDLDTHYTKGDYSCSLSKYMLKKEKQRIKKGEALATKQSMFGRLRKTCISPYDGEIEFISDVSGQVIIRMPPTPKEIGAYIPGNVMEVIPENCVVVETRGSYIQGIFGIGGETHGEIKTIAKTPDDILTANDITEDCRGKVIVGGSMVTRDALDKAVQVGVKGIVTGGIKDEDLTDFLGYKIGVAVTGNENVNLTLIVTEGFGKISMSSGTFSLLKTNEDELACINGMTQIRAGVIRPEIIIPRERPAEESERHEPDSNRDLKRGTLIRLIQKPYFGVLGKVVALPPEPAKMETESSVRILVAELEDGRKVTIPRANVEIIEE